MVIQRGWKILSDTGSTSASSTEANRSPMGGLNSSSDDSNCSNQTTHSMVTSVASPPNSSVKVDTSSINVNNYNHNITTNTSHQQHQQQTSIETMKFVTTPQMAENTLQKLRQRFSNTTPLTNSSAESGMRSLELVRIAVQSAFDKEIDGMVKHFIEVYFKPAFNNIKENLGQGAINDDALQKMSCALLENAKSQYKILRHKPQLSSTSNTITSLTSMSENSNVRMALKRPALNKSSTLIEMQKRFFPDNIILKTSTQQSANQQQHTQTQVLPSVETIKSTLTQNLHNSGATFVAQQQPTLQQHQTTNTVESTQQQQQQSQPAPPQQQQQILHPRRQIFWNTAHISTTTKFILDVQANQAFGFGTEGKERLASKHPELIRYLPDSEDRDWLVNQQIIPQQNRNSRFLFLIYDEVRRLYQTHDVYKNKSSIDLSVMMTFTVPDFMIQKMKLFFVDLNIKSRGLITNSYSIAVPTPSSTIQQAAEQQNSHLRNALLLGTQQSSSSSSNNTTTTTNMPTTSDLTSSTAASTSSSASSSSITSTESLLYQKSKASNLSSSHATLTALLNNSSSANTSMNSNNSTINKSTNISSSSASSTPTLVNKLRK